MLQTEHIERSRGRLALEGARVAVRRHSATLVLIGILLIAAGLRFTGRDWDEGHYLHPDERYLTMVATGIRWPDSISDYFDSATSPLNPFNNEFGNYIYGTFPLFLDKAIADFTGQNVYGSFHLVSRAVSATFDLLTVLLVYLVGRRLFGVRTGLVASLLLSLTVLHIQLSHYGTFDTFVATLCLAAFYFALRANDRGRWWDYLFAGAMASLAIASKLSALPILAVTALPLVEAVRRQDWWAMFRRPGGRALPPFLGVIVALVSAAWTFRIFQPYAFLGPSPLSFELDPRFVETVRYWSAVQSGVADMPPSHQWADRPPMTFLLENLVRWGMGVPLGVTALIAVTLACLRLVSARRWPPTWLVVLAGWPAFHLLYYGTAFIKTMRYVLPAYPFLVLLAAALLVRIAAWGQARGWLHRVVAYAPLVIVLLPTLWYALAFTSIYTRPVTRIAASAWIYENIPRGSTRTSVIWDDGIPLALPGYPSPTDYPEERLDLYANDTPEKLEALLDSLDRADYIFETSNRIYGSVVRMPERFPMTIEYYRMLFSGELGFELVKTFTSHPRFLGIELNDDNAEEAFTVYDHPKVLIFRKTAAYDRERIAEQLGAKLEEDIALIRSNQAGHDMLMMDEAERRVQQAGGTWSEIFDRESWANRHALRAWYLALQVMALAAVPLCWRVLRGLPDRGYAVAKTVGLLIPAWFAWLLASLRVVDFGRDPVIAGIAVTALLSILAVGRRWRDFAGDLRRKWREILFAEVLFLAAFFAFAWLRSKNPDLWHPWRGGEKPMEFAYFNAIIRSTHFPPYDPWFAGGYLNYYYFGWAILAAVVRLTGVVPEIAFNVSVAALFALLVLNAWSFTAAVLRILQRGKRPRRPFVVLLLGLAGPLLVAVIGNLDMARRIGHGEYGYLPAPSNPLALGTLGDIVRGVWRAIVERQPLPSNAFWDPSRIIEGTINEFPYFSFLFADLHPHMMALPFTVAALIVALAIVCAPRWPADEPASLESDAPVFRPPTGWRALLRAIPWRRAAQRGGLVALAGLLTGVLYPLNTWDFPTYVLITAGAFLLLEVVAGAVRPVESDEPSPAPPEGGPVLALVAVAWPRAATREETWRLSYAALRRAAIWTVVTVALGRLFFWPYFAHYAQPASGFDPWTAPTTRPVEYLIIYGVLLFFVVSYLLAELAAAQPLWPVPRPLGIRWTYGALPSGERHLDASFAFGTRAWPIRPSLAVAIVVAALIALSLLLDALILLLVVLLGLTALVAWQRRDDPTRLLLCGMIAVALLISGAVERYTLRGDIGRMNTVFKFYLQVWVLLALAAAVGIGVLVLQRRSLFALSAKVAWSAVAIVLILAGLTYPALATPARLNDRFTSLPRTLDGMAYMPWATYDDFPEGRAGQSYSLAPDYNAIRWLQDNVQGSPVILEGVTPLYRWGSRVSVYTGLPTVIGWDWHQTQQRAGYEALIQRRKQDVEEMLGSWTTFDEIRPLLDRYHVRYIYIGPLERTYYDEGALRKFERAAAEGKLRVAYQEDGVTIYEYSGADA